MDLFVSGIVNEPASNLFGGLAVLLWYKLKASENECKSLSIITEL